MSNASPHPILVVDDNDAILDDYRRIFDTRDDGDDMLEALERAATGGDGSGPLLSRRPRFVPTPVRQGLEALAVAAKAQQAGTPFTVAFVDIRMPPGIDGVETVERLWRQQPDLEVVLCTAHTDYTWTEITRRLDPRDRLVILRKPFEPIEVRQLAACLIEKSRRGRALAAQIEQLEARVAAEVAARVEEHNRHNERLRRTERLESLGRLAAGLAHEINTPTHYVGNNLEFLATVLGEARVRADEVAATNTGAAELARSLAELPEVIEECREGIDRIASMVRNMRAYSHMRDLGPREPSDINAEVRSAIELTRNEYRTDAELDVAFGDLPPVVCARLEVSQVIVNLLINAAHAIRARPGILPRGRITVATRPVGAHVEIEVGDTGVGIAAENAERIFEPFFTTKARGEGTGQGLAIARATIERHGGTLNFTSQVGVGTTFIVRLPVDGAARPA
jgi:two-component system, NtrC family, sensor kinase